MESHKKVLGILFVILASLQVLLMLFISVFFTTLFTFIISQAEPKDQPILDMVMNIVRFVPLFVIAFLAIPGMVAGIGLLNQKPWGIVMALIVGCLNIFSFPFGTAIGVYTIWVFAEDRKLAKVSPQA